MDITFEQIYKIFEKIAISCGTFILALYSIYNFFKEKFDFDILKSFKKNKTSKENVKNIQDLMHNKLKTHTTEINVILHDLLLILDANRVHFTELINEYDIDCIDYKLMKMIMTHEHNNGLKSDMDNWQNIPVGMFSDMADEAVNKEFSIVYTHIKLFNEMPYRLEKANDFILIDLERQKVELMCLVILFYGDEPYAILGVDYSRVINVEHIEKTKNKMENAAFIISKDRYG